MRMTSVPPEIGVPSLTSLGSTPSIQSAGGFSIAAVGGVGSGFLSLQEHAARRASARASERFTAAELRPVGARLEVFRSEAKAESALRARRLAADRGEGALFGHRPRGALPA